MIVPEDLLAFALDALSGPRGAAAGAHYRRSISASYYALFHLLVQASARSFQQAGAAATRQVGRAFSHTDMRKMCEHLRKPKLPSPLDALFSGPPDGRLRIVADSFVKLQQARHRADYELTATVSEQDALEMLRLAGQAFEAFHAVEDDQDTAVFLAALLIADRWKR